MIIIIYEVPTAIVKVPISFCHKKFRKIRLERKHDYRKISGSNGTSEKVVLFFWAEHSKRKFEFHFLAFSNSPGVRKGKGREFGRETTTLAHPPSPPPPHPPPPHLRVALFTSPISPFSPPRSNKVTVHVFVLIAVISFANKKKKKKGKIRLLHAKMYKSVVL